MTNKMVVFQSMLCCLVIIFPSSVEADPEYYYHICRNGTNYTPNNIFQANRKDLLSILASNATQNNGYYNYTAGRNNNSMVYGLSLCLGDRTAKDCQECVTAATQDILTMCPNENRGVIWYAGCIVRYDSKSFFSSLSTEDEELAVYIWNTGNVTDEPQFRQVLNETFSALAIRTKPIDNNQLITGFAYQTANLSALTLYALFQCIPDLTEADCQRCLRVAINLLQIHNNSRGGSGLLSSCIVRYELYPFYGTISTAPNSILQEIYPPPPPPTAPPSPLTRPKGNGANSSKVVAATVAPICVALVIFLIGCYSYVIRKRKILAYTPQKETCEHEIPTVENLKLELDTIEIATVQNLKFELDTIEEATNNFSPHNKIGAGGFGDVFKGVLANEQQIAVKRLSKSSGQGSQEFQNEAVLVAKLQHRNLVRLLGFCLQGDEKILVYEYIQNKSLDKFLFDPERQRELDWSKRFKIVGGIVRGMVYLHEDSRLRIIHRDLKTSNILLDEDMNAKISDFGMARICGGEQTYGNTNRIVGTYGYMSPEYAMHGEFSTKSDVFSFGVLLLEIISGKKNTTFYQSDRVEDLLSYAWKQWKNGTPLELMDPNLTDLYSRNEVLRCIQIGLLCVQENVDDRCSMASVLAMLTSDSTNIALPKQPPFFVPSNSGSQTIEGLRYDQSTSKSLAISVDDSLITGVYGR